MLIGFGFFRSGLPLFHSAPIYEAVNIQYEKAYETDYHGKIGKVRIACLAPKDDENEVVESVPDRIKTASARR